VVRWLVSWALSVLVRHPEPSWRLLTGKVPHGLLFFSAFRPEVEHTRHHADSQDKNGLLGTSGSPAKTSGRHQPWDGLTPAGGGARGGWLESSSSCGKGPGGRGGQRAQAARAILRPGLC